MDGKANILMQAVLLLEVQIKSWVKSRLGKVEFFLQLFAPVICILLLFGLFETGELSTGRIFVPSANYEPVPLSSFDSTTVAKWKGDGSRLGFGPANNELAQKLFKNVCDRLDIDFNSTQRFKNSNDVFETDGEGLDAAIFFTGGVNDTEFSLYHQNTLTQQEKAKQKILNLMPGLTTDIIADPGHQIVDEEILAVNGILTLQWATNLAILDENYNLNVTTEKIADFSLQRRDDYAFDFPNVGAGISYSVFFLFAMLVFGTIINRRMAGQIQDGIKRTLEVKGMSATAYEFSFFLIGVLLYFLQSILVLIFGYGTGLFKHSDAGIIFSAFFCFGVAYHTLTLAVVTATGTRARPLFVFLPVLIVFIGGLALFFVTAFELMDFAGNANYDEGIIVATFLFFPNAFTFLINRIPNGEESGKGFDDDETGSQYLKQWAVIMLYIDVIVCILLLVLANRIHAYLKRTDKHRKIVAPSNENPEGIRIENLVRKFTVKKEHTIEVKTCGQKKEKTIKKKEILNAVDGLSLNIKSQQVFCLLGQNGAGKSTTFNMLTGSMKPSSGIIKLCFSDPRIGLCPQFDIRLNEISCLEQLILFARVGGKDRASASEEAMSILEELGLSHKADETPRNLSGGQLRRLSVAAASVGNSNVLFFDEPTTGLDPLNCRRVWSVIRRLRAEGRTMILTTHSMEEASALSDYIAIMSKGKLQASGTTEELRKHYGPWYHLRCVRKVSKGYENYDAEPLMNAVKKRVPKAHLISNFSSHLSINIPEDSVDQIPSILDTLNEEKDSYQISSFSISPATLDDVFVRLASEEAGTNDDTTLEIPDEDMIGGENAIGSVGDLKLQKSELDYNDYHTKLEPTFWKQYKAMVLLELRYSIRNPDFIGNWFFCIIIFSIIAGAIQFALGVDPTTLPLEVGNPYDQFFLYGVNDTVQNVSASKMLGNVNILELPLEDVKGGVDESFASGGFAFENVDPNVLLASGTLVYNPSSFKVLRQMIQRLYQGKDIIDVSQPSSRNVCTYRAWKSQASVNAAFATGLLNLPYQAVTQWMGVIIVAVQKYRYTKLKDLLLLSGLEKSTFYLSLSSAHFFVIMAGCLAHYGIVAAFGFPALAAGPFYVYFVTYILMALASITWFYSFQFAFSPNTKGDSLMSYFWIIIILPWAIVTFMVNRQLVALEDVITLFVPPWAVYRVYSIIQVADYNSEDILSLALDWDFGITRVWLMLFCSFILYFLTLMNVEFDILRKIGTKLGLVQIKVGIAPPESNENALQKNVEQVMAGILPDPVSALPEDAKVDDLVIFCENAGKTFKSKIALQQATFGTEMGSITGLLGPNGAGKSTLIKGMSGVEQYDFDVGNAFIEGKSIRYDINSARKFMGVCPQFDAFMEELTPREHFKLVANLRGVPEEKMNKIINSHIQDLDLSEKADERLKKLSGGNKRKTSLGLSMVANSPAIFLDEPTTGIDTMTKHKIWEFILNEKAYPKRSVVITTHSMEEADTLCSRIAIMVDASIRTAGTPEDLKQRYGGGLVVDMTLSNDKSEIYADDLVGRISEDASRVYTDARQNSTRYKYAVPMTGRKWSDMFHTLHNAPGVLDFSLSQKSLEDVFVQLAELQTTE